MRKLTGYIGAMIIVFALMGSILAGYALNINGTNTVMNEYEKVTDVSGLYSHTQEPSYIDYNPASNYIGYDYYKQYISDVGNDTYKVITNGTLYLGNDGKITLDGNFIGDISTVQTMRIPFISDGLSMEFNPFGTGNYYLIGLDFYYTMATDLTITISGTTTTVNVNGNTYTYPNVTKNICYWTVDNTFDYYKLNGRLAGNNTNVYCYINELTDLYTYSKCDPNITPMNPNNDVSTIITRGYYYWTGQQSGVLDNAGPTAPTWGPFVNHEYVDTNVYRVMANYTQWNGSVWYNNQHNPITLDGYSIFYPRTVNNDGGVGINYTESNRVNNYLMQTEYVGGSTTVTTQKLNLTPGMGLTDNTRAMSWGTIPKFWRANSQTYTYNGVNADVGLPTFTGTDFSNYTDNIRTYDILDIFDYYSITPDQPITIKPYGTSDYTLDNGESIGDNNFAKLRNSTYGSPGFMDDKWYCIYYPDSGLFDFYDKNDVKTQTSNVCYVSFCGSNARYGAIVDYNYNIIGYYDFGTTRPTPYLEISYTTETGGTTVYHYADITKGYSIKNDNITNVTWNNAYVNGVIELLFRAENTQTTYHNDIIVGDNNISIDYSSNRFNITLNGGDPVDIGTWRNIVLNIDLTNGYLSVIPVRTFNSYTNVVLDNTNTIIGNLINPAPTNIIEWQPTANSLDFNIYSTSVFMNSYGVVMVDPTLDVTQYFTNLDNFYQMRLYNFSIYGQSMTINGVTGTVTGGTITFNDETIQIKDMKITYADGNVIISDSYANIDLGAITDNTISMTGAWYFITELYSGYTTEKVIYDWDWGDFILDDKAFGVIYIGLCLIGLIVARKFCTMTITDYLLFIISIVIALTVPVIA